MTLLKSAYEIITILGSYLLIPFILFVVVLIERQGWKQAGACGLTICGCLVAINIMVSRLASDLGTITSALIARFELGSAVSNVHWSLASAITFSKDLVFIFIPASILLNIILLLTDTTTILNLDLWSLWQTAFIGVLIENLTFNFWYGFVAALLLSIAHLLIADYYSGKISNSLNTNGITFSNPFVLGNSLAALGVNALLDKTRLFSKHRVLFGHKKTNNSFLTEPSFLGLILSCILGLLSGIGIRDAISFGLIVCGVCFALPRVLRVLSRALSMVTGPIKELAKRNRHLPTQFAMPSLIGIANPTTVLISILMVPAVVFIGHALPGNVIIPEGDIASLLYVIGAIVALSDDCVVRSLLSCITSSIIMLYSGTLLTKLVSQSAIIANPAKYAGSSASSLVNSANPLSLIFLEGGSFSLGGIAALGVCILALIFFCSQRNRRIIANLHSKQ